MGDKTVILGAGIAGIAAGYKLGNQAVIYEATCRFGGLCDNFIVDGFRFDYAVHLSFTKDKIVRSVFDKVPYITHKPEALNYCDGYWVKHPIQNNLFAFPIKERIDILKSFIEKDNNFQIKNYEDWLFYQYGQYFTKKYPGRYTRKYWCCEAAELTVGWVKNRMYRPSIDEVLYGAMTDKTPNTYYAKEMRYPIYGGYRAFFENIVSGMNIKLKHEAIKIDIKNKKVFFGNGKRATYDRLISSLPLPTIISLLKDCPTDVIEAANNLYTTSMCLVSVGFNKKVKIPSLWFYVYDEDVPFARVYSPSMKSKNNVPQGKSSLQFEIYYTKRNSLKYSEKELKRKVTDLIIRWNISVKDDIQIVDTRHVEYANVVFYQGMEHDRKVVLDYLNKIGIKSIGRFGEWDYFWSDQSFLSGFSV